MVALDDVKNSLRIDHTLDDELLQQLIETASEYIVNAIDSGKTAEDFPGNTFEWAVSLLTQHWYLNRQEASSERIPVTVQALVQQLRGASYADSE